MSETKERPQWDDYYLDILGGISRRASCPRRQGAALIVDKDHRLLSSAYNGPPARLDSCLEKPCEGVKEQSGTTNLCIALHAEHNAVFFCGDRVDKADTMYCSTQPCTKCALTILQTPIKKVVFIEDYPDEQGVLLLMKGGVYVEQRRDKLGSLRG